MKPTVKSHSFNSRKAWESHSWKAKSQFCFVLQLYLTPWLQMCIFPLIRLYYRLEISECYLINWDSHKCDRPMRRFSLSLTQVWQTHEPILSLSLSLLQVLQTLSLHPFCWPLLTKAEKEAKKLLILTFVER